MSLITVVMNGKAAAEPKGEALRTLLESHDARFDIQCTKGRGDAERFAADAMRNGAETVIAAGGDGTISEVVCGLLADGLRPETALGVLPLGTANDFARGVGIPIDDEGAALDVAMTRPARLIDAGRCDGRYFVNVTTGGFAPQVQSKATERLKEQLGPAAYTVAGLVNTLRLTPCRGTFRTPDREFESPVLLMAVGNGRFAGAGYRVAPKAMLDDGLLDIAYVHKLPFGELNEFFDEVRDPANPGNQYIGYFQAASLDLALSDCREFHIDGEPIDAESLHFEAVPHALRARLPEGAPLGASGDAEMH